MIVGEKLAYWGARVLRRAARTLEAGGRVQRVAVTRTMATSDMAADPDEAYYRDQYWRWLEPELTARFPERSARLLDIGCGQGRLSLPAAAWLTKGSVVGVDFTPGAVAKARGYADRRGLRNVEFHEADALEFVLSLQPGAFDVVLMTEVAFVAPDYKAIIAAAANVLRAGGLFFASFRSQYFDLLCSVRSREWSSAALVRDAREGHWGGGPVWFSWHTVDDVRHVLGDAGFAVTRLCGIGIASGLEGDPLAPVARPSRLSASDLRQLMDLETSLAEQYAGCGRYILAIAVKPRETAMITAGREHAR